MTCEYYFLVYWQGYDGLKMNLKLRILAYKQELIRKRSESEWGYEKMRINDVPRLPCVDRFQIIWIMQVW